MEVLKGYLVIGTCRGVKHYFMPSIKKWTSDFNKVSLSDINENKLEVNMEDYPLMDPEYSHQSITIS